MPLDKVTAVLSRHVADLEAKGTSKGKESIVRKVLRPEGERGPRFLLEGEGDQPFIRMNSNSYLGMSLRESITHADNRICAIPPARH